MVVVLEKRPGLLVEGYPGPVGFPTPARPLEVLGVTAAARHSLVALLAVLFDAEENEARGHAQGAAEILISEIPISEIMIATSTPGSGYRRSVDVSAGNPDDGAVERFF